MKKYVSYSELRTYWYSPEEYYKRYVLGEEQEPNDDMKLGSLIHKCLEEPRTNWLVELKELGMEDKRNALRKIFDKMSDKLPPADQREVGYRAETKEGEKLFGVFDVFDKKERLIADYKTTDNPDKWQFIIHKDKQLSFYAWMLYLNTHSFFKEMTVYAIDTKKGNVKTLKTARGPMDIEHIEGVVKATIERIKERGWWEKRLSREDQVLKATDSLL